MAAGEFSALFHKNFIIWKRNRASLVAEYIIVIAFACLLGLFRHYSTKTDKPDTSYLGMSDPHTPTNTSAPYPLDYGYLYRDLF